MEICKPEQDLIIDFKTRLLQLLNESEVDSVDSAHLLTLFDALPTLSEHETCLERCNPCRPESCSYIHSLGTLHQALKNTRDPREIRELFHDNGVVDHHNGYCRQ
ncbi:MAG: hypothetical protein H7831_00080 [Magnetococcus sp. WYHC-3]